MKHFVFRILIFVTLFVFIKQVIGLLAPYYWGNPWMASKITYLEKNNDSLPNVFFFGSSRVYRQIDPTVFDDFYFRLTNKKKRSFNLGASATFSPQTYYLYTHFLDSQLSHNTELVFMELTSIDLISDDILHQERTRYWLNVSDINFVLKSIIYHPDMEISIKFKGVRHYISSYMENIVSVDYFGKQILKKNNYNKEYIGPENNGFYSYDDNLKNTKDSIVFNNLLNRKNSTKKDTSGLSIRASNSIKIREKMERRNYDITLNKMMSLIELSEKKGIKLVFTLFPRNMDNEISYLSELIPQKNLLDLSNANTFPELYYAENSFDTGHLNKKGSKILTKILVQQYLNNSDN